MSPFGRLIKKGFSRGKFILEGELQMCKRRGFLASHLPLCLNSESNDISGGCQ